MATEKLYWNDPWLTTFEAPLVRIAAYEGKPSLVFSHTVFYPEGGGQLGDTGVLESGSGRVHVLDVQVDEPGDIHHLVDHVPSEPLKDAAWRGTLDLPRRRDHMAQHTAQHMLSRALADVARAETVSARLGAKECTIDVSRASLGDAELDKAADLVNAVIRDDVPVRAHFPSPEELRQMPLRRAPKVATGIRVIEVEGFDFSPCGGTHCTRTGQIGALTIARTEAYKGGTRVSFHAAGRALADARARAAVLGALAADLTCGPLDVPLAIQKLRAELKARLDALSAARGELVELVAAQVLAAHPPDASGTTRVVLSRPKDDVTMLRALAGRLASRPDVVAFCSAEDPESKDMLLVVQRGASASFDAGQWLKKTAAKVGGRGGGRPERAEGRLSAGADLARESLSG